MLQIPKNLSRNGNLAYDTGCFDIERAHTMPCVDLIRSVGRR